tara:strand:- start:5666 stop:5833 length:168 start_codon:yes stop_codon:yes gene_type:complete
MNNFYNEYHDTVLKMNLETFDFVIIGHADVIDDQDVLAISRGELPEGWIRNDFAD